MRAGPNGGSTAMRIGIVGLLQESNTFIPQCTTLEHFSEDGTLAIGERILEEFQGGHHEVSGFLEGLSDSGHEIVPLIVARALPYGAMTRDTFETLLGMLRERLAQAGRLDGVLAACHGADVAEGYPDADGEWLAAVRTAIGTDTPLIATLDAHANLTRQMVQQTDALIGYRTNPHVDQRERGLEAARLLMRTLAGEVRPVQAAAFPPLVINIQRQDTDASPLKEHLAAFDHVRRDPRVLSASLLLGFPYADVPQMGCATLVVADGDPSTAHRAACERAAALWEDRQRFIPELIEPAEAVRRAAAATGRVCLLDMGDNVGGGSPGDGTALLHELAAAAFEHSFVSLHDPMAVQQARSAGVGQRVQIAVGGRSIPEMYGPPYSDTWTVRGIYDGRFDEDRPRHGGFRHFDQGPTAVLTNERGITVLVNSKRMVPFSLRQLTSCNLDPRSFRCLVAKGVHAPIAAYREVCDVFIRANTPGVTTADLDTLPYRHRRRPLFPFERDFEWAADAASPSPDRGHTSSPAEEP
ncbi:MAG: M81 family peptidase [Planctomycetota bacterium]|nr:MAG: M81 family peptidase [Planctomycetota bacterium]